ncbi:hypothetical protein [Streptomyces halstedii]
MRWGAVRTWRTEEMAGAVVRPLPDGTSCATGTVMTIAGGM